EIVFVQSFDLLGLPRHLGPAPAEAYVGMMALALGELPHLGYEIEGFLEILEAEASLDSTRSVDECPARGLLQVAFGGFLRQWRGPAAARNTNLGSQIVAHCRLRLMCRVLVHSEHTCRSQQRAGSNLPVALQRRFPGGAAEANSAALR